jgi:superfamily II DNA or RNA helicase
VRESIWFAQQFCAAGTRAAHIDGNGIWIDGQYRKASPSEREEILAAVRSGEIKVLCNRFVLREGLDLPEVSHIILATVMGSLQTYLQSVGRGLRAAPGEDRLTIQDHGGHWWRHGSVNVDREWNLSYAESIIAGLRENRLREKREPEPIRCPKCGLIRQGGAICPECKHESTRGARLVVQTDGRLVEHTGDIFPPRRVTLKNDTVKLWTSMYYRAKRAGMTFRQAEGLFYVENGYYPPHDIPLMPTTEVDWFQKVHEVPTERLTR